MTITREPRSIALNLPSEANSGARNDGETGMHLPISPKLEQYGQTLDHGTLPKLAAFPDHIQPRRVV